MVRFGLAPLESRALLESMLFMREHCHSVIVYFASDKQRQMQSINRYSEEYYEMATKAKKTIAQSPGKKVEFAWKGFVDVKLDDNAKANLSAWDVADSDVWDGIAQYCEAGVKISVSYNPKNASFTCAGTGQAESGENNGYCVVAYAKDPYTAARVWLFKVATILPAVWSEYDAGDSNDIG